MSLVGLDLNETELSQLTEENRVGGGGAGRRFCFCLIQLINITIISTKNVK